jgi:hypothetical protein
MLCELKTPLKGRSAAHLGGPCGLVLEPSIA